MHLETANNHLDAGPYQASLLDDFKNDFNCLCQKGHGPVVPKPKLLKISAGPSFHFQYIDIDNIMAVL